MEVEEDKQNNNVEVLTDESDKKQQSSSNEFENASFAMELPTDHYGLEFPELKQYDLEKYLKHKEEIAAECEKQKKLDVYNETTFTPLPISKQSRELLEDFNKDQMVWDCEGKNLNLLKHGDKVKACYPWNLPETDLSKEYDIRRIEMPVYKFTSKRTRLSKKQLSQVWKTCEFKVQSEIPDLPHVWRLTTCCMSSSRSKNNFLKDSCARSLRLLFSIPNCWNPCGERVCRYNIKRSLTKPNFFNVFACLFYFLLNIFDFFFGIRLMMVEKTKRDRIERKIYSREMAQLNSGEYGQSLEIAEYLHPHSMDIFKLEYEVRVNEAYAFNDWVQTIEEEFRMEQSAKLQSQLDQGDFDEAKIREINKDFLKSKQADFFKFFKSKIGESPSPGIAELLFKRLESFVDYQETQFRMERKIEHLRSQENKMFLKKHSIYGRIGYKKRRAVEKLMKPKIKEMRERLTEEMLDRFSEKENEEYVSLVNRQINFQAEFPLLRKAAVKALKKENLVPVNQLFMKYPLLNTRYKVSKSGKFYYLTKMSKFRIRSVGFFYKFPKVILGYFVKLFRIYIWIFRYIWDGKFGIRGLFSCGDYYRDWNVDRDTGILSKTRDKTRPFIRKFIGVIHGIQKSRKRFENSPDTGLFGKGCGRFCNILECYLVRLIIVGVFGILIIHPIINIITIISLFIVSITAIVWFVLVDVSCFVYKVLIYDYKSTSRQIRYMYIRSEFYEYGIGRFIMPYRYFPILRLLFDLFVNVVLQLLLVAATITLNPILSLLNLIFSVLGYIIVNIMNWMFFRLILTCCARVPSSDSSFARRISGPGISRDFYCSLEPRHVSLLIISTLERIELDQLVIETKHIINAPKRHLEARMQKALGGVVDDPLSSDILRRPYKNLNFLTDSLEFRVNERKKLLPQIYGGLHTIRFTDEGLDRILHMTQSIIEEVIEEKEMDRYIWKKYDLKPGMIKRLSRTILKEIFTSTVLESVEKVDHVKKVKYSSTKVSHYLNSVVMEEKRKKRKKIVARKKRDMVSENVDANDVIVGDYQVMKFEPEITSFYNVSSMTNYFGKSEVNFDHPFRFRHMRKADLEIYGTQIMVTK